MSEVRLTDDLILWDPEIVRDWFARNEFYRRLRERANAGIPALSVLVYADVLRVLRLRRMTESQFQAYVDEMREQFVILELTADLAEAYATAAMDCA